MNRLEQPSPVIPQAESSFEKIFESTEFKVRLDKAMSDFSKSHINLSDTNNAKWQCIEVSWEFIKFLNDTEVIIPEMVEQGVAGVSHANIKGTPHTVAKIGNKLIDWTYRQFDPESPFPYVYSL